MALEQILARIDSQAQERAEEILNEGRGAAAKRLEAWKERGRQEADLIAQGAHREVERLKRQAQAEAKLALGNAILGRKRAILSQVTETAWRRMMEQEPDLHRTILAHLLETHHYRHADVVIFSGDPLGREAGQRASISRGADARPEIRISSPEEEPRGGFLLHQGPVNHNLSFARLLEDLAERHQVDIQKILFGEAHA